MTTLPSKLGAPQVEGEPFSTSNIFTDGDYLLYCPQGYNFDYCARFLARFKHTKKHRASFKKFLIRNFTPEEYLEMIDPNGGGMTPVEALRSKGWEDPRLAHLPADVRNS